MKKEILYHILFWLAYLLLWSAKDVAYFNHFSAVLKLNAFTLLPFVCMVYLNLFVLLPRYLFKKKYTQYVLFLCLSILLITSVSAVNHFVYFKFITGNPAFGEFFFSAEGYLSILTETLVLVGLSTSIYLLRERYFREKFLEDISKKQLEVELKLLKEQINPHFLFNSLNSIYMMWEKDGQKAKEMLLRFSDILSYQLHETAKSSIPLEKEIQNIANYIGIESIRHGNLATITFNSVNYSGSLKISPMFLLPVIENAFKHSPSSSPYFIDIDIALNNENQLNLKVVNTMGRNKSSHRSGLGLINLQRRLELVYPRRHEIEIKRSKKEFTVNLNICLDD